MQFVANWMFIRHGFCACLPQAGCTYRAFESSRPAEDRVGNSHPARNRENW
jgi:hypothetical protein